MKRPLTESLRYIDASSLTSEEFNTYARSLVKDITVLFNDSNDLEENLKEAITVITQENISLYKKIKELESLLLSLEETIESGYGNKKTIFQDFYSSKHIEVENASHEQLFGFITLPQTDMISSIYRDYDKEFLRRNVNIEYQIEDDQENVLEQGAVYSDPNLVNLIDKDITSYWSKKIETEIDINRIFVTIKVDSSTRILPTLFVNAFSICPYPVYSSKIEEISYINAGDNSITRLTKNDPSDPDGIFYLGEDNIGNIKHTIPQISAKSFIFKFSSDRFINIGEKREFFFGLRNLNLEFLKLSSEIGTFTLKYTLPLGKTFSSVNVPIAMDYGLSEIPVSDLVRYELFLGDRLDTPFSFNSRIRSNTNTIGIKSTMIKRGSQIPSITGLKIDFETK